MLNTQTSIWEFALVKFGPNDDGPRRLYQGEIWTHDLRIRSHTLDRLSYKASRKNIASREELVFRQNGDEWPPYTTQHFQYFRTLDNCLCTAIWYNMMTSSSISTNDRSRLRSSFAIEGSLASPDSSRLADSLMASVWRSNWFSTWNPSQDRHWPKGVVFRVESNWVVL